MPLNTMTECGSHCLVQDLKLKTLWGGERERVKKREEKEYRTWEDIISLVIYIRKTTLKGILSIRRWEEKC